MAGAAYAADWRDNLVGPALAIAESDSRSIRVCAGPGTGKSFAMRSRVARLLADGVDPETIFAVTFTRAAARDLRTELLQIDVPGADKIRARTLHSYCHEMLSTEQALEATGRYPRILMKFERRVMLHDLKKPKRSFDRAQALLSAYEASWARDQDTLPGEPSEELDRNFQLDIISWLRFHKAMVVGELATEALRFLRENPQAEQKLQFTHVLVDEYQDLNRANQILIDLISENAAVVVVGDEDQSIYSSLQHAQPEGIREFSQSHEGTTDIGLVECRRCPQLVVSIANSLIDHNGNRATQAITPRDSDPDGHIDIIQYQTMSEEAEGIASIVKSYIDDNHIDPGRVMVLSPRRVAAYYIRQAINVKGIPVHSYFFEEALDRQAAQERFTLLALIANRDDRVSLRCWLAFGQKGLAIKSYGRLRAYCHEHGRSPFETLEQLSDGVVRIPHTSHLVSRYRLLRAEIERLHPLYGEDLVNALFPDGQEDLEEIRIAAHEIVGQVSNTITADELYKELRTRILFPEPPPAGGAVRLMSLHSSKGLSGDLVVVSSCVESWIPSPPEAREGRQFEREIEEQRRLFYVALTRTTDSLVVTSFRRIRIRDARRLGIISNRKQGGDLVVRASRFISELGDSAPTPRAG